MYLLIRQVFRPFISCFMEARLKVLTKTITAGSCPSTDVLWSLGFGWVTQGHSETCP